MENSHRAAPSSGAEGSKRRPSGVTPEKVEEAIRASTPRRPALKLRKPKSGKRRGLLLTEEQILEWADAWKERTGEWPKILDGPVPDATDLTWGKISHALTVGDRGLPGGSSLPMLLVAHRSYRSHMSLPRLTEAQILAWADAYHASVGNWPTPISGPIVGTEETWYRIHSSLRQGDRGLPGGSSLFKLLKNRT